MQNVVRTLPLFFSGLVCNLFIGFMAAYIPIVWLLGPYVGSLSLSSKPLIKVSGAGTLSTSTAILLFAMSKPSVSYWALEFPALCISVVGIDFVFPVGSLFIAKFALPHEQSMAGALFNTAVQVCLCYL